MPRKVEARSLENLCLKSASGKLNHQSLTKMDYNIKDIHYNSKGREIHLGKMDQKNPTDLIHQLQFHHCSRVLGSCTSAHQ